MNRWKTLTINWFDITVRLVGGGARVGRGGQGGDGQAGRAGRLDVLRGRAATVHRRLLLALHGR